MPLRYRLLEEEEEGMKRRSERACCLMLEVGRRMILERGGERSNKRPRFANGFRRVCEIKVEYLASIQEISNLETNEKRNPELLRGGAPCVRPLTRVVPSNAKRNPELIRLRCLVLRRAKHR